MITAGLAMLERCTLEQKARKSMKKTVQSPKYTCAVTNWLQHLGPFTEPSKLDSGLL